jgi:hypothetical protein
VSEDVPAYGSETIAYPYPGCEVRIVFQRSELYTPNKSTTEKCLKCGRPVLIELKGDDVHARPA